ncbi:hypothetical protein PC113_g19608 [Phytophthora cactorum]|uniref:Uncharacterized protein n=1 Tax=Phytophthora cactorum TaxID=29920 RepID=A0A8T0YEC9_9STRA|nr:hypothetical protein PC113_g19608 [Phytophthora cactorum]
MAASEAALSFVDEFADGRAAPCPHSPQRNERRIEVAYLREKVAQLEAELESLQQHRSSTKLIKQDGHDDSTSVAEQSAWKPVAQQQRKRREKAEIENARLKLVLES